MKNYKCIISASIIVFLISSCSAQSQGQRLTNGVGKGGFISIKVKEGIIDVSIDSTLVEKGLLTGLTVSLKDKDGKVVDLLSLRQGVVYDRAKSPVLDLRSHGSSTTRGDLNGYRIYLSMVIGNYLLPVLTFIPYFGKDNHPGDGISFNWDEAAKSFRIAGNEIP
jgi:hypothetical protein